jgi:hypothetical protein
MQGPKSQRDESNKMVARGICAPTDTICPLDALRIETNDLITGVV